MDAYIACVNWIRTSSHPGKWRDVAKVALVLVTIGRNVDLVTQFCGKLGWAQESDNCISQCQSLVRTVRVQVFVESAFAFASVGTKDGRLIGVSLVGSL